jgi:hypothetical protein
MSAVEVSCPGCGSALRFEIGSSLVKVCEHCRSAVARGDRRPEDLGKVAAVTGSLSPLALGLRGKRDGVGFHIVGHVQFAHPAGGTWDEWYAAFTDDRWGWIAEAQGRFFLTFAHPDLEPSAIPAWEDLSPGELVSVPGAGLLSVGEVARAEARGAEGEIPYRFVPGEELLFADVSGPKQEFATLAYEEGAVRVYLGAEVTLEALGLDEGGGAAARRARQVEGIHLSCPHCAAPLELRAPDRTERVGCPSCGSLLDASQGELRFFRAAEPYQKGLLEGRPQPAIPLGTRGTLDSLTLTVIAFLRRSVEVQGSRYRWSEYLLLSPDRGYFWLVCSDGHWSFVQPVPPGMVTTGAKHATFGGKRFKAFQSAVARVDYVAGEVYWKVTVGEEVRVREYVLPPEVLAEERSTIGGDVDSGTEEEARKRRVRLGEEVNWSAGRYVFPREIEAAFGVQGLRRGSGVGPSQPFVHTWIYKPWGLAVAALLAVGLLALLLSPRKLVFEGSYSLLQMTTPESSVVFSEPFELGGWSNIKVSVATDARNAWLYLQGDLIDEESEAAHYFGVPVEHYSGYEGGESWSEGSPESSTYLSALPAGRYLLRLEFERVTGQVPAGGSSNLEWVRVRVEQGRPRFLNFVLALLGISVAPVIVGLWQANFEHRRWEESSFSD